MRPWLAIVWVLLPAAQPVLSTVVRDRAVIEELVLADSDLRGSSWIGTRAARVSLERSDMRAARVQHSDFRLAKLRGVDGRDSVWIDVDLRGADLRDADLRGAVFIACQLKGARYNAGTKLPEGLGAAARSGMVVVVDGEPR